MERFPTLLRRLIQRAGYSSLRAFDREVSTGNGVILNVCTGHNSPPMKDLEHWADALGLKGEEREEFRLSAALEHSPAEVREEFLRLRAVVKRLERREAERQNQQSRHQARDPYPRPDPPCPTPPGSALLPPCSV